MKNLASESGDIQKVMILTVIALVLRAASPPPLSLAICEPRAREHQKQDRALAYELPESRKQWKTAILTSCVELGRITYIRHKSAIWEALLAFYLLEELTLESS